MIGFSRFLSGPSIGEKQKTLCLVLVDWEQIVFFLLNCYHSGPLLLKLCTYLVEISCINLACRSLFPGLPALCFNFWEWKFSLFISFSRLSFANSIDTHKKPPSLLINQITFEWWSTQTKTHFSSFSAKSFGSFPIAKKPFAKGKLTASPKPQNTIRTRIQTGGERNLSSLI